MNYEKFQENPFLWYVDVKDEKLANVLSGWIKELDGYNVNAHIYQNTAWNFDLILSSKRTSKQRGRENIGKAELFAYLNVIVDAFKMANE